MARAKKNAGTDQELEQIRAILAGYEREHPRAKIDIQRQNNVSVRIRVIDPDFKGMGWVDRDTALWKILDQLPEEVLTNITLLLPLTPQEAPKSFANMEFENPIPSRL